MGKNKLVVVFGIFDGVHEGHRSLFKQARKHGGELVGVVGRDAIAEKLKGRKPKHSEKERVKMVETEPFVDKAVLGDEELSVYTVLEELVPDVVCLGYDQQELYEDVSRWIKEKDKDVKIVVAEPYKPEIYRNSLLNGS